MIKYVLALVVTLCLSACATVKTPAAGDMANADFGQPMTQAQVEEQVHIFFDATLKDPGSAQIMCGNFKTGWMKDRAIFAKTVTYGYRIDCQVNAKNSYGGYTGFKSYKFLARDGRLQLGYEVQPVTGADDNLIRVL